MTAPSYISPLIVGMHTSQYHIDTKIGDEHAEKSQDTVYVKLSIADTMFFGSLRIDGICVDD